MDIVKLLQNEGIDLANNIRANMISKGQWATGQLGNSLRIEVKQEGTKTTMQLIGDKYFMVVQTGRKPTPGKKPSREMISNITRWTEARGIDLEAVLAIATKIQNKGTELWRAGGRTDIVDPAVKEFEENTTEKLLQAGADDLVFKIKQMKWK